MYRNTYTTPAQPTIKCNYSDICMYAQAIIYICIHIHMHKKTTNIYTSTYIHRNHIYKFVLFFLCISDEGLIMQ